MIHWKDLFRIKSVASLVKDSDQFVSSSATLGFESNQTHLRKTLGVADLTAFGIAAVLGAGVFSTIGNASAQGGPAVIFLYIFTAIACGFSALCYAEFASSVPTSGTAYSYAYATFGEIIAWIIGWDLLVEYAIGNIAVVISWSQYLTRFLEAYGIRIPKYLTMDYLTASRAYHQIQGLLDQGITLSQIASGHLAETLTDVPLAVLQGYHAWLDAPRFLNFPIICDVPALLFTLFITWVVYIGIRESKIASNILVILKLAIVLLVIIVGSTYVQPSHWIPFAPNGASGVLKGVSAVFFSYIGFDAISATAEECKNPQRDLPRGMLYSLLICTVLYVVVALVLTGMVGHKNLAVGDPLAYVFGPQGVNMPWIEGIINISALIALATVVLVFQIGQPRIWMVMSRDGLLPPIFSSLHPKYQTPWFSTIVTGFVVAIPSLFMNLTELTDLTSIGTLFAFILVCGGILKIHWQERLGQEKSGAGPLMKNSLEKNSKDKNSDLEKKTKSFKTPYINGKVIFPGIMASIVLALFALSPETFVSYFSWTDPSRPGAGVWEILGSKFPMMIYIVSMVLLSVFSFIENFSLIPLLGLASCGYLMTELGMTNWVRFGVWMLVGIVIYFFYGFKHSRLQTSQSQAKNWIENL